jgi:hypothetical protein
MAQRQNYSQDETERLMLRPFEIEWDIRMRGEDLKKNFKLSRNILFVDLVFY